MVGSDGCCSSGLPGIQALLSNYPHRGYTDDPTEVVTGVYLGNYEDADSFGLLADIGITHVLNCAPVHCSGFCQFPGELRLRGYCEIPAEDIEGYDITQHFAVAFDFIARALKDGGKVLVYCAKGRNRSAAVCVGYLVKYCDLSLVKAVRTVSEVRGRILTNTSFVKQLYVFNQSVEQKLTLEGIF